MPSCFAASLPAVRFPALRRLYENILFRLEFPDLDVSVVLATFWIGSCKSVAMF